MQCRALKKALAIGRNDPTFQEHESPKDIVCDDVGA